MIITRLTLENYKQYRGEHVLDIAEDATIGVIGANGVGKTTIFEAIEWCLYKPRGIENQDIRPRGTGGEVRVVLQLTTNDGASTFEVERVLKRSSTQATIYAINEMGGGEPIVQGTREVTDYISSKLIGLGHTAFVATFFTRQKELSFFGTMRPAERRREVGKLLGLETIKQAQQLISEDRSKARAQADSLLGQYEAMTGGRDLDTEIEEARALMAQQRELVDQARKSLEAAEEATIAHESSLQAQQELRDRYTSIANELRNLETRLQHAKERRNMIVNELERLAKRETERGGLAKIAASEPALRAERERLEMERERFQQCQRLESEIQGCGQSLERSISDLRSVIDRAQNATDDPGWTWTRIDEQRPIRGIDRLVGIASAGDAASDEARLSLYLAAVAEQKRLDVETTTLKRYRDRQRELEATLDTMLRDGDPRHQRETIEAQQNAMRARLSETRAQLSTLEKQESRQRELVGKLQHQHLDEACPTCGRPFDDDETELVIRTMRQSIEQHRVEMSETRQAIASMETDLERLQQALQRIQEIQTHIQDCRTRLTSGLEYVGQQEAKVEAQKTALQSVLKQLGLPATPSTDEVTEVERQVARGRALRAAVQPLHMIRGSITDTQEVMQRHESALADLVDIDWDPATYQDVSKRFTAASNAVSAVHQIDRELARRPQLEHELEAVERKVMELDESIAEQTRQRDEVEFDPTALHEATTAVQQARIMERERRTELSAADRLERDAGYRLETLLKDEQQIKDLAEQAEQQRRSWQELDLMYREFSEFDKFAAQRLTPLLSETTSDIVAEMTDGKYTRVEFDEDYGIQVYDDSDERFPLETFSGGERDAISLAARLALSRLIGSQAANPPGFLVLDEVFGSLDAERRERVLTLLGQHSTEFFRQMFIISHVDDVQQSPVFDTIWQVAEREDGSSEVNIGAGEAEAMVAD